MRYFFKGLKSTPDIQSEFSKLWVCRGTDETRIQFTGIHQAGGYSTTTNGATLYCTNMVPICPIEKGIVKVNKAFETLDLEGIRDWNQFLLKEYPKFVLSFPQLEGIKSLRINIPELIKDEFGNAPDEEKFVYIDLDNGDILLNKREVLSPGVKKFMAALLAVNYDKDWVYMYYQPNWDNFLITQFELEDLSKFVDGIKNGVTHVHGSVQLLARMRV